MAIGGIKSKNGRVKALFFIALTSKSYPQSREKTHVDLGVKPKVIHKMKYPDIKFMSVQKRTKDYKNTVYYSLFPIAQL